MTSSLFAGGRILVEVVNPDCDHNNYLSYYEDDKYGKCISCDSCGEVAFVFVKEEKRPEKMNHDPSGVVRRKKGTMKARREHEKCECEFEFIKSGYSYDKETGRVFRKETQKCRKCGKKIYKKTYDL